MRWTNLFAMHCAFLDKKSKTIWSFDGIDGLPLTSNRASITTYSLSVTQNVAKMRLRNKSKTKQNEKRNYEQFRAKYFRQWGRHYLLRVVVSCFCHLKQSAEAAICLKENLTFPFNSGHVKSHDIHAQRRELVLKTKKSNMWPWRCRLDFYRRSPKKDMVNTTNVHASLDKDPFSNHALGHEIR